MANTNVKETVAKEEVNVKELQKQVNELQEKIANLENVNAQLNSEKEQVVQQLKDEGERYTRLFKLYANNLDFYLADGGNK